MRESKRYLGVELAGARNQKTALAALEYYPVEKKIFLLDIFDRIVCHKSASGQTQTGDEALLELINELRPGIRGIGVNVALDLPPCMECVRKSCPMPQKCAVPAVRWMRDSARKMGRDFTPYTQRPLELWLRQQVLPKLPESHRFDIDETLGGNRAPLTARLHFLKRHLKDHSLIEVLPKLSVAILAERSGISKRAILNYRKLEEGVLAREEILEALTDHHGIFIYERDIRKLALNLPSFDAFICAYTALLADRGECVQPGSGFPRSSGWVHYPR